MNQKSVSQIVTCEEAPTNKVKGSSSSPWVNSNYYTTY